jgi:tetratricopeptide (TPR) repeat protein
MKQSLIKELYRHGKALFEEGKYAEAELLLRDVIKLNPGYADVLNKLGVIAHLKGELKEAAGYFERALSINPRYTEASLNLAITYNELGQFQKAQEVFTRAAQIAQPGPQGLDPFIAGKMANEHFKLGNMYMDLGLLEEAIGEYEKALRLHDGLADVHTKLGIALRARQDYQGAVRHFQKAKEVNPKYGQAWVQLGLTYYMQGRTEEAVAQWEAALREIPDLQEAKTYLKLLRGKEGS